MKKNETQSNRNTNREQNNIDKLFFIKSIKNTVTKFNLSRNSFPKNTNKTSSNFILYKNSQISNSVSKDNSNKNKKYFNYDINSISNKKMLSVNFHQIDINNLHRISPKNLKKKLNSSKTYDTKINSAIIDLKNKTQIKKRKIDFIKNKFLLGQKNYFKRMFGKDDFNFSSYYSKKINPYLKKNPKRCSIDIDKLKKLNFFKDERNINSIKELKRNYSISSYRNLKSSYDYKNNLKIANYINIKFKKNKIPDILKPSNGLLFNYENSIITKRFENSNENINQDEFNKSKTRKKIIDYNYNGYLKGFSLSDRKDSRETTNIIKKNHKCLIQNLKQLNNNNKVSLIDESEINEIYQYRKLLNKNNYSNIIINNNKKLFKFKKLNSNRSKNINDIYKSIKVENYVLLKK